MARVRMSGDDGTSLMELIIGMALMTVFMAMFTGAVVLMTSSANKVQAVTTTSQQINQAFLRLDRLVRYASAISTPAKAGASSDWYVELSTPNPSNVSTCSQLRVDRQQLQLRTWTVSNDTNAATSTASPWQPLASSITNGAAAAGTSTTPFFLPTSPSNLHQQLQLMLTSSVTSPASGSSSSRVTFTALNSTAGAQNSATTCQQWGRP
ncbi:MAG: hypothetical protein JWO57_1485 [Pseudonocardiales bacterium]|nr:hypothetical protein [Pseudonocardiales bacterium]